MQIADTQQLLWCSKQCQNGVGQRARKCVVSPSRQHQNEHNMMLLITHGTYDDIYGDLIDIGLGCQYVAMEKKSFTLDTPDWGKFNEKIGKKETVVAAGVCVNDPNSGHIFLVNGTTFIDGYGDTQYKVTYIEPVNAQEYTCNYDEFISGEYTGFKIGALVLTK